MTESDPREVLRQHWGHDDFRSAQREVVDAALAGNDVLAVLPTGYGKSATFQIPAMIQPGCALVISPLIALMKDQTDDCIRRGIRASYVNSHVDETEQIERFDLLVEGAYDVFYVAPERIWSTQFLSAVKGANINFLVVDEAHCHPAGTLIDTPDGHVPIERLRPGDEVLSWDGARVVTRRVEDRAVKRIGRRRLLRIVSGAGGVTLTSDHPVWVMGRGYVPAEEVHAGDRVLSVRPAVSGADRQAAEVLQPGVLAGSAATEATEEVCGVWEDVHAAMAGGREGLQHGMLCEAASGDLPAADAHRQSDGVTYDSEEGIPHAPTDWPPTSARRQRASNAQGAGSAVAMLPVSRRRVLGWPLAHRRRVLRDQARGGVRWGRAQGARREGTGCAQNLRPHLTRVDRVEVLEPADYERDVASGRDNRVVYSLTVGLNHNYFANGILNHNCVSRWGHDFRPAYLNIHKVLQTIEKTGSARPPVLAVTATATRDIESDVARGCGMDADNYVRVVGDPIRPNLQYIVQHGYSWAVFEREARKFDLAEGRFVVYAGTRNGAEKLSKIILDALEWDGIESEQVGVYHAGMSKPERERVQDAFKKGTTPIVVATNAFGMGIDVPNIRAVVHFGIPGSLEDYCQESGRAGRDGLPSRVVLIDDDFSHNLRWNFLDRANPPYSLFVKVWEYLHSHPEGTVLHQSGTEMAKDMGLADKRDPRALGWAGDKVRGVLNTMEAYGAVERTYTDAGTVIDGNRAAFEAASESITKASAKRVYRALWDSHIKKCEVDANGDFSVRISKSDLMRSLRLSFYIVAKILKSFDFIEVGRTFTGKTTKIRDGRYGEQIGEVVDEDAIVAKRKREEARLEAMIQYTRVNDRLQFIRDYFLCTEAEE